MADAVEHLWSDDLDRFVMDAVTTVAIAEEAQTWLITRLALLEAEIKDEARYPPGERDAEWYADAKAVARRGRDLRQQLVQRRAALARAERQAEAQRRDGVVLDILKEVLTGEEQLRLWREVHRRRPDVVTADDLAKIEAGISRQRDTALGAVLKAAAA